MRCNIRATSLKSLRATLSLLDAMLLCAPTKPRRRACYHHQFNSSK